MMDINLKKFLILKCIFIFAIGFFLTYPLHHDFQLQFAQGDHGRDLYVFKEVLNGAKPYKDFWWLYGPLMLNYYSFFYKVLGTNIHSILLAHIILITFSGVFFFLILELLTTPFMALAGTVCFYVYNPPFHYTYNHAGASITILAALFCLIRYKKNFSQKSLWSGLGFIFITALIKINFGFSSLIAYLASVWMINLLYKKPKALTQKYFYMSAFLLFPVLVGLIYFIFLKGLPLYWIRQCFPYWKGDNPWYQPLSKVIFIYGTHLHDKIISNKTYIYFFFIFLSSFFYLIYLFIKNKIAENEKKETILIIAILGLFSLFNLHEYIKCGIMYRSYWAIPTQMLLVIFIIAQASRYFSKKVNTLLFVSLLIISLFHFLNYWSWLNKGKEQTQQFLSFESGKFYSSNSVEWFDTVKNTTHFLNETLKKEETFLAFPYDPLYYFLCGKQNPVPELVFFKYKRINPEQEQKIIHTLEKKKVNYVLISNRIISNEIGLGYFGRNYCPNLYNYFENDFEIIKSFGIWDKPAQWIENHGIKILRRKQ